jgi:hypothetical protein
MIKAIIYIATILTICSCTSNNVVKKPIDLIPKDKMVELLVDMNIAKETRNVKNIKNKKNINYMNYVYEKHKIDSSQFKASNAYYIYKNTEYQEIYKRVHKRIKDSLNKYEAPIKLADSIKKAKQDSISKLKKTNAKAKKE